MSTEYEVYRERNPGGPALDIELRESGTDLSLVVTVNAGDYDPVEVSSRPLGPAALVEVVANLVRPYTYQYPGAEGRDLINKLKVRLEDVWHGR